MPSHATDYPCWDHKNRLARHPEWADEISEASGAGYKLLPPDFKLPAWQDRPPDFPGIYVMRQDGMDAFGGPGGRFVSQYGYPLYVKRETGALVRAATVPHERMVAAREWAEKNIDILKPVIVCAALRHKDGGIITGPRHCDGVMLEAMEHRGGSKAWLQAESGFIDQYCRFHTREEAWVIAREARQVRWHKSVIPGTLYSEDLY